MSLTNMGALAAMKFKVTGALVEEPKVLLTMAAYL